MLYAKTEEQTYENEVIIYKLQCKSKSKYRYVGKIVWDITPTLR